MQPARTNKRPAQSSRPPPTHSLTCRPQSTAAAWCSWRAAGTCRPQHRAAGVGSKRLLLATLTGAPACCIPRHQRRPGERHPSSTTSGQQPGQPTQPTARAVSTANSQSSQHSHTSPPPLCGRARHAPCDGRHRHRQAHGKGAAARVGVAEAGAQHEGALVVQLPLQPLGALVHGLHRRLQVKQVKQGLAQVQGPHIGMQLHSTAGLLPQPSSQAGGPRSQGSSPALATAPLPAHLPVGRALLCQQGVHLRVEVHACIAVRTVVGVVDLAPWGAGAAARFEQQARDHQQPRLVPAPLTPPPPLTCHLHQQPRLGPLHGVGGHQRLRTARRTAGSTVRQVRGARPARNEPTPLHLPCPLPLNHTCPPQQAGHACRQLARPGCGPAAPPKSNI